jgi:phage FluMu gp28-like protein
MDVATVEVERAQDPMGFAQEYLCRPVSDEYRFLTTDGIRRAQERGAARIEHGDLIGTYTGWSPATHARNDGQMVMGVDIGIDRDDTAIAVFEHVGDHRYLRFHTMLDPGDFAAVGINSSRVNDPSKVANYINRVVGNMSVDKVFLDKTGPGKGFQKEVEQRLGRKAQGFNFSDKDEVNRMMGDFNYALHNDEITLVPGTEMKGQLEAIVKEQRHETSKPKYSGKQHAPNGKDDLAMALILGSFPPDYDADRHTEPETRENVSEVGENGFRTGKDEESGVLKMIGSRGGSKTTTESQISGIPDDLTDDDSRYNRRHNRNGR